jgi:hypothetical protein
MIRMIHMTRLTLILIASALLPWHLCDAGDGAVSGDTRYKFSHSDKVAEVPPESTKVAQTENRKIRRVAPRWRHLGSHWYYLRAGEIPWWPNAPGD